MTNKNDFLIEKLLKDGRPTDRMIAHELQALREHIDKMIDVLDKDDQGDYDFGIFPAWLKEANRLRG